MHNDLSLEGLLRYIPLLAAVGVSVFLALKLKTTRKLMEQQSKHAQTLFDHNGSGHLIVSSTRQILEVNHQLCAMFGYEKHELIGQSAQILHLDCEHYEAWAPRFQEARGGMVLGSADYPWQRKDGSVFWCAFTGVKLTLPDGEPGVIWSVIDITGRKQAEEERLKLEQQLLHAQKLESLGVLAGGIAHDFNNILTSIVGNADLALMRLSPESPAVENLHRIEKSSLRAADLAKQMLAYSGKGKFVIEQIDLNHLVEDMLHMLEVSISKKAVLRLNLQPSLPAVAGDATQLRQVIMNLVINASEAIGDKSGVIAISSGAMECDRNYSKQLWLDENIADGLYIFLEIADTGCGMDKETLGRIFDPFFTTKFTGRGLGMAAVLGIIRGHKGAIKVYSEPGRGTTFKVLLPAGGKPAEAGSLQDEVADWQSEGTVLLVDDEDKIREIGSEMLRELGFQVITADDGRHALEQYRAHPDTRLVILDLTMPHLDGEQAFRELRRIDPAVKVVISSGYNEQEISQKFAGKGLYGFIQKPYRLTTLREVIRKILPEV